MTVIAIVSEYNPFHRGHQYMIEQIRNTHPDASLISIMSGSFVQRGEPAIVDKWSRAEIAIHAGINLVIELPFYYACQPAESFAKGAIDIIQSIGCVDVLAFGGETDDIAPLLTAARISANLPNDDPQIRKKMNDHVSFSEAKLQRISELFEKQSHKFYEERPVISILRQSNNILAIEYLKHLLLKNSSIQPLLIARKGSNYGSEKISGVFSSASAIRSKLRSDSTYLGDPQMPEYGVEKMENFFSHYHEFHALEKYENLIFYLLDNSSEMNLSNIHCADPSFVNRVLNMRKKSSSLKQLTELSSNIGISRSKIQRFYCQLLNQLDKDTFFHLIKSPYLRVLASDSKGFAILKYSARLGNIVISKFSNHLNLSGLSFEARVTDNYFSVLKNKNKNMDFLTSPVFRK